MRLPCRLHENGFHGAELPGCVQRAVFHGYADKTAALGAMSGQENLCPVCGGQMTAGKWYPQQGRRYLSRARCEADGEFYIRIRLVQEDGALRVSPAGLRADRAGRKELCRAQPEAPPTPRPPAADSPASSQSRQNRKTDKTREGRAAFPCCNIRVYPKFCYDP